MNNNITNWSYDKPTEEGLYLICNGDIEVQDNIEAVTAQKIDGQLIMFSGNGNAWAAHQLSASYKYAKLCFGSEAKG